MAIPFGPDSPGIGKRFNDMDSARSSLMARFRTYAALTLPRVLPEQTQSPNAEMATAYQAFGATGVANLVSKLMAAIFPPGVPFWRHRPAAQLYGQVDRAMLERLEQFLYQRDLKIFKRLEGMRYRTRCRFPMESCITVGTGMLRVTNDYKLRPWRLDHYVVEREFSGDVIATVTRDRIDVRLLTDEQLASVGLNRDGVNAEPDGRRRVDLYTLFEKQADGTWTTSQEMNGRPFAGGAVEGTKHPAHVVVGYAEIPGEDYSRGFVEERIGDLRSLNGQSKAILDFSAAAAKLHPVVDEASSGALRASDLMKPTGTVLSGNVGPDGTVRGVGWIRMDKFQDFRVTLETNKLIEERLGKQFLFELAAQPQGERVTATQILRIASELEGALGTIYTSIADEFQLPLLNRVIYQMEQDKELQPIPEDMKNLVQVQLITGAEAISRQAEMERLLSSLQIIAQIPGGPERIRMDYVITRVLMGHYVNVDEVLKTQEEIDAERRKLIQEQLAAQAGAKTIDAAGNVAEQAMAAQT